MAKNLYFSDRVTAEQQLYENIVIESLKMYGQDVYYLPRDIVNEDKVFGDDVPSRFNSSYKVEMYIENTEGFDGEGDLFTKFGVEIRDQATFVVARKRWSDTVQRYDNEITVARPAEGDLIYLPLSNSLFQIMHVEHEQPFYQLSNLPVYKLRAELFEYNDEDLDTGIDVIDDIERSYAYAYNLTMPSPAQATASISLVNGTGSAFSRKTRLGEFTILNSGAAYSSAPTVTFSNLPAISDQVKFGNNSLQANIVDDNTFNNISGGFTTESHRGILQFWVYPNATVDSGTYQKLITTGLSDDLDGLSYRSTISADENMKLVLLSVSDTSKITFDNLGADATLNVNEWNHVAITVRGSIEGLAERTLQVYLNGVRVYLDTSNVYGGLLRESYSLGGEETVISWYQVNTFDGYIDDFHASTNNPAISSTINVPTAAFNGQEVNAAAYESFNTTTPEATTVTQNGNVTSVALSESTNHNYFKRSPTISIAAPSDLAYVRGETVRQTLSSGITISGEVANWSTSTRTLKVIHVGADDGNFHNFVTSQSVTGITSSSSSAPAGVSEDNQISENEQNDDFETIADGFLDFTETNPFGDPNES